MKPIYLLFSLLVLASSGLKAAPPAGPVHVVAVAKNERMRGTITLPNHNTLLFFPALSSNKVRVVALQPSGATAWEATLQKAQTIRRASLETITESLITMLPMFLTSADNTVYSLESITDGAPDKGLPQHALVVQALSADGQVAGKVFTVPPPPQKTERVVVTAFAEEGVVYALVREASEREQTSQLYLDRCDLRTGKLTQTAINLPALRPVKHADDYCFEWVLAGYRAGTCYFYRVLKGADAKTDARRVPVEFEVKLISAADCSEQGGFVTQLHNNLPANSFVQGSTAYDHHGLAHAPRWFGAGGKTVTNPLMSRFSIDSGGDCEVVLEEATGNLLFAGQYTNELPMPSSYDLPSQGTFVQRYAANGALLQKATAPYALLPGFSVDMLLTKQYSLLSGTFLHLPQSPDYTFEFYTKKGYVVSAYDAQLAPAQQQLLPMLKFNKYTKSVYWSGPSYLQSSYNTTGASQPSLAVETLQALPTPLHQKVGQLVGYQMANDKSKRAQGVLVYTASSTGPNSALVISAPFMSEEQVEVFAIN